MKRFILPLAFVLIFALAADQPAHSQAPQTLPPISVYFSPNGGCTEAVVKELNAAKASVLVQAYSFTSTPIAKALVDAHKQGVKVEVILDKSQRTEKYSSADFVRNSGIPTWIDAQHAIAHNKIMVIDGEVVITGSFNFTNAAERSNAENLLVIRDKGLADKYTANWQAHARHSEQYTGRDNKGTPDSVPQSVTPATAPRTISAVIGFVASRNSEVFHRSDCKSAATIAAKNVIRYTDRDAAVRAGKKPCAECKP